MDKRAIKRYATWARRELITRVSQKAEQYGITADAMIDADAESIHGVVLTPAQVRQRQALIRLINRDGFDQAMEEVAYTWFNRFIALRFMEANDYLPDHTRAFTDGQNQFRPQILADALHLTLDRLDLDRVISLKEWGDAEALYRYLLITLCNHLSSILPGMFQRIDDYTELLFPDHLLRAGSVLDQLVTAIPLSDWLDAVQIIGWLYQYYNAEPKDQVFANLKKNIKINKQDIPAATQLFTPDWIVRYMVENSLGRLWAEGHPNDNLQASWPYYLPEAAQTPEVTAQLAAIRGAYAQLHPTDIRCIDPCAGSGHILVYLFDVLMQIYTAYGYTARDAVAAIVRHNLWGLDIDDRAAQLACFAVMMKARQYDSGWFRRGIVPQVYALQDSPEVAEAHYARFGAHADAARRLVDAFQDAKEYGNILQPDVTLDELDALAAALSREAADAPVGRALQKAIPALAALVPLVHQARALVQPYHVVVTNPPYMGASGMGEKLSQYVKNNYPDSRSDLFAVFMERIQQMLTDNGYQAMITQHAWMFLSSFEKLRKKLQRMDTVNMAHLGARAFEEIGGEVVQTTSFVLRNSHTPAYAGTYCRLIEPITQQGKEDMFLSGGNRYTAQQNNFAKIPGAPVAYWVSEKMQSVFFNSVPLQDYVQPKQGTSTGNNNKFLRLWYEPSLGSVDFHHSFHDHSYPKKWYPATKGGDFRKYFGNNDYVVDWQDGGLRIRNYAGSAVRNPNANFHEGLTWTGISSSSIGVRYCPEGFVYTISGKGIVGSGNLKYALGFLCSKVASSILEITSPTLSYEVGYIATLPLILNDDSVGKIDSLVNNNISLSRADWDAFETSWDFQTHPLVRWMGTLPATAGDAAAQPDEQRAPCTLEKCYLLWRGECEARFNQLKANEEELNRIFIDIYGLQGELTPEVADRDVTVRRANLGRDIRSLISYAVGCMLGRYALDKPGLAFAGGEWHMPTDGPCLPDRDGVLPITDDAYFSDDILTMFIRWVRAAFGEADLEENLKYIASALYPTGGGTARDLIRQYFLNDFYKDHVKVYQKRPIYWLFDAGKRNSFKCLIYLHRYQPDTIARIRTDYVHEMQARYRSALEDLAKRERAATGAQKVQLGKQLAKIRAQEEELLRYEEKIHHYADMMLPLDLDDGVKVNYAKLGDVLAAVR